MKNKLKEIFKKIEYTPFPEMTMKANLADQFTEYALNCIVDELLANGVIVPPCKVGDTVYRVMADKRIKQPYEYKVIGFWYSADETCNNLHLVRYVNGVFENSMSVPFTEFNRILFLTKEEAERALKEREKV